MVTVPYLSRASIVPGKDFGYVQRVLDATKCYIVDSTLYLSPDEHCVLLPSRFSVPSLVVVDHLSEALSIRCEILLPLCRVHDASVANVLPSKTLHEHLPLAFARRRVSPRLVNDGSRRAMPGLSAPRTSDDRDRLPSTGGVYDDRCRGLPQK